VNSIWATSSGLSQDYPVNLMKKGRILVQSFLCSTYGVSCGGQFLDLKKSSQLRKSSLSIAPGNVTENLPAPLDYLVPFGAPDFLPVHPNDAAYRFDDPLKRITVVVVHYRSLSLPPCRIHEVFIAYKYSLDYLRRGISGLFRSIAFHIIPVLANLSASRTAEIRQHSFRS
jgi:hypothetical protein